LSAQSPRHTDKRLAFSPLPPSSEKKQTRQRKTGERNRNGVSRYTNDPRLVGRRATLGDHGQGDNRCCSQQGYQLYHWASPGVIAVLIVRESGRFEKSVFFAWVFFPSQTRNRLLRPFLGILRLPGLSPALSDRPNQRLFKPADSGHFTAALTPGKPPTIQR
jgi:hypothetical protein